ncbi:Vitamin B6 transporter [Exophiala xenobiotica]|nr:Vitamin B6 transporter [Exophiala xenobiotica]KAK5285505.1 Vitamin B6 transporter [Exophiala xenobiotica]KAK5470533.1 Vitamin B6 transporter [Exophiala xenobiotica]
MEHNHDSDSITDSSRGEKAATLQGTHVTEQPHQNPVPHDYLSAVENGLIEDLPPPTNFAQRWAFKLERLAGVEARGIERVPEAIRAQHATLGDYAQMGVIWFSANVTMNNVIIGFLGPLLFEVGLKDAMILSAFGAYVGAAGPGYISSFGPLSGNRTMVVARYTMGWWPSRVCVLFNIVIMLGYGLIDILLSGQILAAVNGKGLTIIVGTIISAIVTLIVVLFGIRLFHTYERYAFIPQVIVLLILIGVSGPFFDTSSPTIGTKPEQHADRMSFFFLAVSAAIAWTPSSADFYVYFPPKSSRLAVFACTTIGLGTSCAFTYMIGVGIASGVVNKPEWNAAYEAGGAGALLVAAFKPLGSFGDFCSVIVALGLIANNIPGTYSAALSFQLLGRWLGKLPRIFWTVVGVVIYTVCACAGRDHLFEVFQNFLALLGYFVVIYIALTLEEEFIFRPRHGGFDWARWNDKSYMPYGIAAMTAFCIGWVGAVLGMWQTYFTGPLGKTVGFGIDLGIPLAMSFSAVAYPPLRFLELKFVGK